MALNEEDLKILGGIGGGFGGAVMGANAATTLMPLILLTGPFAPLVALGVVGAGIAAGAATGSSNPKAGLLTAVGGIAGIPTGKGTA